MVVYRGLDDPRLRPLPAAVAVGIFDGFHLGHRRILDRLSRLAERRGLRSLVLTFDPHPERVLGLRSVPMITTLDQRLDLLWEAGADAAVVIPFDRAFARLDGPAFVDGVLGRALAAREVVVGRRFRFGRNRRCGTAELGRLGRQAGIGVHVVPPVVRNGRTVSSTLVRRLLGQGRTGEAARLLGRPYEVSGRVVRGRQRGRRLGFPTANLETDNEILPPGVFISETVRGGRAFPSVTSVGTNPTFGPGHPLSVETLLLGFHGPLYGAAITVRFLGKIRPTRIFGGAEALAAAIGRDVATARAWFDRRG